jgi:hypothetical protein
MTSKEKKEIALDLSKVMETVLSEYAYPVDIANASIEFYVKLFNKFPDLKPIVEEWLGKSYHKEWLQWEESIKPKDK